MPLVQNPSAAWATNKAMLLNVAAQVSLWLKHSLKIFPVEIHENKGETSGAFPWYPLEHLIWWHIDRALVPLRPGVLNSSTAAFPVSTLHRLISGLNSTSLSFNICASTHSLIYVAVHNFMFFNLSRTKNSVLDVRYFPADDNGYYQGWIQFAYEEAPKR